VKGHTTRRGHICNTLSANDTKGQVVLDFRPNQGWH
jgi:hypothetical protein